MRSPVWRIRAFVIVALLFWQCGQTATGPEQQTLRERLIGTWWSPADESDSLELVGLVLRFRDDGFMTIRGMLEGTGSFQWEMLYARWELENDSLTVAPIREPDRSPRPSFIVMIAFEDEALILPMIALDFEDGALILPELDSDERITFQPGGIPPEAIPEGNALHGTVTYSDGPYDRLLVLALKPESGEVFEGSVAVLLVEGEWELFGLEDGTWFVEAQAFREGDGVIAADIIVNEAGDAIPVPVGDNDLSDLADFDGIPLEGGDQVVTGIDIVLRAPGQP